jgi:hypothetical protein
MCIFWSPGIMHRAIRKVDTNFSKENSASMFRIRVQGVYISFCHWLRLYSYSGKMIGQPEVLPSHLPGKTEENHYTVS